MNEVEPLKIGIIGASGFGKYHGDWFSKIPGCEVTTILGSTKESAETTAEMMSQRLKRKIHPFHELDRFVTESGIQVCSVVSPNDLHFAHTMACLEAGLHVMCEKPLTFDKNLSLSENIHQAEQMVETAKKQSLVLAMNTHLAVLAIYWQQLYEDRFQEKLSCENLEFQLEVASRPNRSCDPSQIALDLLPHTISLIDTLYPDNRIDPSMVKLLQEHCDPENHQGNLEMTISWQCGGQTLPYVIELGMKQGNLQKRFGSQRFQISWQGYQTENGFKLALNNSETRRTKSACKDTMQVYLEEFIDTVRHNKLSLFLVDGDIALRQHRQLLGILEACWPKQKLPFTLK